MWAFWEVNKISKVDLCQQTTKKSLNPRVTGEIGWNAETFLETEDAGNSASVCLQAFF